MAEHHKLELKEAADLLQFLMVQSELLQEQIAKQKRKVAALTELANEDEESCAPTGLVDGVTDAVRTVFMGAEKGLTPREVKRRVEALGLPPQQNLLASVHTVIKRLLDSGEIEPFGDAAFGGYRWKQQQQPPAGWSATDAEAAVHKMNEQLKRDFDAFIKTISDPVGSGALKQFKRRR